MCFVAGKVSWRIESSFVGKKSLTWTQKWWVSVTFSFWWCKISSGHQIKFRSASKHQKKVKKKIWTFSNNRLLFYQKSSTHWSIISQLNKCFSSHWAHLIDQFKRCLLEVEEFHPDGCSESVRKQSPPPFLEIVGLVQQMRKLFRNEVSVHSQLNFDDIRKQTDQRESSMWIWRGARREKGWKMPRGWKHWSRFDCFSFLFGVCVP